MSEWKPIETAPKDGTEILVWGGTYCVEDATYPEDYPSPLVWAAVWIRDRWVLLHSDRYDEITGKPSHWMPFPDPPLEVTEQ